MVASPPVRSRATSRFRRCLALAVALTLAGPSAVRAQEPPPAPGRPVAPAPPSTKPPAESAAFEGWATLSNDDPTGVCRYEGAPGTTSVHLEVGAGKAIAGSVAIDLPAPPGTACPALRKRYAIPELWSDEPPKVSGQTVPAPDWVAIAKALKPAVVNVSTKRVESGPSLPRGLDPDDPFAQFFRQFERRPHAVRSLGSGFIIHPDGYAITNAHVIQGETKIKATVFERGELDFRRRIIDDVEIIAVNNALDLAMVKLKSPDGKPFPTVYVQGAEDLAAGQEVFAIGAPLGLELTLSQGVIATTQRNFEGMTYVRENKGKEASEAFKSILRKVKSYDDPDKIPKLLKEYEQLANLSLVEDEAQPEQLRLF